MQQVNKLGNVFGPVGSVSGYFITLAGVALLLTTLKAIVVMILGLFVGFTSYHTYVDFDKNRFRSAIKLFGIIPVGRWQSFESTMQLSLKRTSTAWRTWSQGNRSFDVSEADYRLQLLNKQGMLVADLQRFSTLANANDAIAFYSEKLGLSVKQQAR